jgi:hypothetical protein
MCSNSDLVWQLSDFPGTSVRLSLVYKLFLPDTVAILQGLHGRPAFTEFTLIGAIIILGFRSIRWDQPVTGQLSQIFSAERNLIELLQYHFMEPFTDVVCLWWFDLGFGVIDIVNRQNKW